MISSQLKAAIESSGLSLYRIALDAGIDQAVLRRFVNNDADIRISTIDKLADALRLELAPVKKTERHK